MNTKSVAYDSALSQSPPGSPVTTPLDERRGLCQNRVVTPCTPDPAINSLDRQRFHQPADTAWLADSNLPINYGPESPPLEEGVRPEPDNYWQEKLQWDLKPNGWWNRDDRSPESVSTYEGWVAERKWAEKNGEEFKFPPLKATLENIKTFVAHILAGKQFPAPLSGKETRALEWVQTKAQELLDAEAPYKRTVHLVIAFMCVCDIATDRLVLAPAGRSGGGASASEELDPELVAGLSWGGNNPGGEDEKAGFLCTEQNPLYEVLKHKIHVPGILILPSFDSPDVEDFYCDSHLPVYPVGISTAYELKADGVMGSAMMSFWHDLARLCEQTAVGEIQN
ncbi:MAG: hypothetical protein OXC07_05225 [Kistimonas sp.]|nr:hypothetical protein [Kistimonas sp.]